MGSTLSAIRQTGKKEYGRERGGRAQGNAIKDTALHFKPRPHRRGEDE